MAADKDFLPETIFAFMSRRSLGEKHICNGCEANIEAAAAGSPRGLAGAG